MNTQNDDRLARRIAELTWVDDRGVGPRQGRRAGRWGLVAATAAIVLTLVASTDEPGGGRRRGGSAQDPATAPIPTDTEPPHAPQYWPESIRSASYPVIVHYRTADEEAKSREVLGLLEQAWAQQVGRLGFRAPLDDRGLAGPDGAYDVYIWRGNQETYVTYFAENVDTPWDDAITYMVVDPWGTYGGPVLSWTVVHEFNHASQASYSWFEHASCFESTATLVETSFGGLNDQLRTVYRDFQNRPHWSLARNDDYETWYMYGGALFLAYLRDRHFGGDESFLAEMWERSKNGPGADEDQWLNEPDFVDALDAMLKEKGASYEAAAVEFARWRYYTGSRDDGKHIAGAAGYAEVKVGAVSYRPGRRKRVRLDPRPQTYGTTYVEVRRSRSGPDEVTVSLRQRRPRARLVVQAVPGLDGGSDGEMLDLSSGSATLQLGPGGKRTLVITAVPRAGDEYDPDTDGGSRHRATLTIESR